MIGDSVPLLVTAYLKEWFVVKRLGLGRTGTHRRLRTGWTSSWKSRRRPGNSSKKMDCVKQHKETCAE